jgi:hypothetical protein
MHANTEFDAVLLHTRGASALLSMRTVQENKSA